MSAPEIEVAATVLGGRVRRDVPLGPLTTYRVGGRAALYCELQDQADVEAAREAVSSTGLPVLVMGKGSNLLVSDAGFAGLVVVLGGEFSVIQDPQDGRVRAGAAVSLPVLARRTAAAGLTGFEWAVG
ncbi:MAG: FAD-binding protein, partial [Actinobacteria bacterium]|nr:FAD-binding protein [Actinomycetota bacterium]